jgi:hypothetical protein
MRLPCVKYLVASSFSYDRYFRGVQMAGQRPEIQKHYLKYKELFSSYEYTEIQPKYKTYLYSNPVIRIVHLDRAAAARRATD